MEIFRTVQLYTNKVPPPTFGKLVKNEELLHGKFQSHAYAGSRKSRMQQTLKRDLDYQKKITDGWRKKGTLIEEDSEINKTFENKEVKRYRLPTASLSTRHEAMSKSMYNTRLPSTSQDKRKHFNKTFNGKEKLETISDKEHPTINRQATCEIDKIHLLTHLYETREYHQAMEIDEMKDLLEEKRNMYWKLIKDINTASFHFKGIQDTCQSIDKFSESAHITKKNAEKMKRDQIQTDEEIKKLLDQRDNLKNLMNDEQKEIDQQKFQFAAAKEHGRDIKKERDTHERELRLTENHQCAMEVRTKMADKYEEMMEARSCVRRKLNTRLHKFIKV